MKETKEDAPSASQELHGSFKLTEWENRHLFIACIEESAKKAGITVQWLSEYWVAKLTKGNDQKFISAYMFPLNDAASAAIARDKVAAYQVLDASHVPAVKHWLVRFPENIADSNVIAEATKQATLPLVLKPCDRGSGSDVYKATTHQELVEVLHRLAMRYRTIAASPLEDIQDEFRVVVLDEQPVLLFRKARMPGGDWRHNLQFGAQPVPVTDPELAKRLHELAVRTATTLGLRFCAVDIITASTGLKVMEVNAGLSMSKVAATPAFKSQVMAIYDQAVAACFDTTRS